MYEDDPQDRVFDMLGEAIFGAHPLGRPVIGTAEVVGAVDARAARARSTPSATCPATIVIAAAGSVDHDALVEMAASARPRGRSETPAPRAAAPRGAAQQRRPTSSARVRFLRERHRAVPRVPRRRRASRRDDERRFALRVLEGDPRRHLLLAALPGGARAPRPRLLGVLLPQPLRRTPARSGSTSARARRTSPRRSRSSPRSSSGCVEDPASEEELTARARTSRAAWCSALESTGARMSRLGASVLNEHADPLGRRDDRADRRGRRSSSVRELAARAVRARAPVGRRRRAPTRSASRRRSSRSRRPASARARGVGGPLMIRVARRRAPRGAWGRPSARRSRAPRTWSSSGAPTRCSDTTLEEVLGDARRGRRLHPPDTALENALACVRGGRARGDRHDRLRSRAAAAGRRRRGPRAGRTSDRPQLRDRRGADDALRRAGGAGTWQKAEIIELHHDASSTRRAARPRAPPS